MQIATRGRLTGVAMRELLIVGTGGHARELLWLASRLDRSFSKVRIAVEAAFFESVELMGIKVESLDNLGTPLAELEYVVAIGDSRARERIAKQMHSTGATPAILIDPSVLYSDRVSIGRGSVVCAGSILTSDISIGAHVHINSGCLVHHDAKLCDYATLSPGVKIAGNVEIGAHAFVGIGASIVNGTASKPIRIGEGCVIAAGACVTCDVPARTMVAGVPAKHKRFLEIGGSERHGSSA